MLTAVATLVLALGIGTNTAIFAVIDGALFRPPPGIYEAEALVDIRSVPVEAAATGFFNDQLTYAEFLALREDPSELFEVAALTASWSPDGAIALRTSEGLERVSAELVSSAYFGVLRTPVVLGSAFQPGDDRPGNPVLHVVLGHGFWNRRMGGSVDVIGRQLTLNGYPFTIIGVAAERFHGAGGAEEPFDVWLPANASSLLFPDQSAMLESTRRYEVIARLAPGVSEARVRAAVEATGARLPPADEPGPEDRRRLSVVPYIGLGATDATEIMTVVGGVGGLIGGIILLIACVNVSALLLGRSLERRREIAIRLALGAGRATIVRQLLTESVLLGLMAGAFGILLAIWALDALGARLFTFPIQLSARSGTLAASIALAACTGILFGMFPALHATRSAIFTALKDAVPGGDPRASGLRRWFAIAQLALSLPLLAGAGMLISGVIGSVRSDSTIPDPERLFAIWLDLRPARFDPAEADALLTEGRLRVATLPGVASASFARSDPLSGGITGWIQLPGDAAASSADALPFVHLNAVDTDYFATTGVPLVRGRAIDRTDVPGAMPVVVIDEDLARRLWPAEDPIGQTLTYVRGRDQQSLLTVVGVTRGRGAEWDGSAGTPVLHASRKQFPDTLYATLLVRTAGEPASVIPRVRETMNALDPRLVVSRISLMADRMRESRIELSHASAGASGIGLIALMLACIGVYAVVASGVAERKREIGIRMALGASRDNVVSLFVHGGLRLAFISIALGIPLSFGAVRVLGAGMFGVARVTAMHAGAMFAIALVLIAVAALSSWIPARHSVTLDPVDTLRAE
jgi:predicted permease